MKRLFLSLGFLVIAGCGSTPNSPSGPTPTAAEVSTTTPHTSPTPDVYATAKAAYLAAATTANKNLAADNAALKAAKTPAQEQAALKVVADSDTAFRAALFAIQWPAEMKVDANALIGAVSSQIVAYETAARAADPYSQGAALAATSASEAASNAAANVVRHDLGLPPIS